MIAGILIIPSRLDEVGSRGAEPMWFVHACIV